jgi:hypothetical protein
MLALLAANAYLGIEDANLNHIYWFVLAFFILVVGLLLIRLIGLLYAAHHEKKASWTTFYQLAKTRGLNGPQSEVLAIVARQAKISRPPKVLGSIQLLDKAIQKAQDYNEFSEKQLILIDSVRKKLVSSKVRWTANSEERRQLERANCSWNTKMVHISKGSVDKAILKITDYDGDRIKGAIAEIQEGDSEADPKEYKVQIRDISAGGVALLVSPNFAGTDGDYALLYGDSQRIPFAIEGLHGEIQSIEEDQERGCLVLHYRFLLIELEMRKGIIEYVYEKMKNSSGKDTRETEANQQATTRAS